MYNKYKVLQYFSWGKLDLEPGQNISVEDRGPNELGNLGSQVTVEHYPDRTQLVATAAVESMIFLKNIEKTA